LRSKDKDTHPASPNAGAHAFRQAIDAVMQGIKFSDYAEEHEELKTALTKWGGGRTGFQMHINCRQLLVASYFFCLNISFFTGI
jgi:hypothetical protein